MLQSIPTSGRLPSSSKSRPSHHGGDEPPDSPIVAALVAFVRELVVLIEYDDFSESDHFFHALGGLASAGVTAPDIAKHLDNVPTTEVILWMESVRAPEQSKRKAVVEVGVNVLFVVGLRIAGKSYEPMTGRFIRILEEEELRNITP